MDLLRRHAGIKRGYAIAAQGAQNVDMHIVLRLNSTPNCWRNIFSCRPPSCLKWRHHARLFRYPQSLCAARRMTDHGPKSRLLRRSGQDIAETVEKLRLNGSLFAMMALLINAGPTKAGDCTGANEMPAEIHNLMNSQGYVFDQKTFNLPEQNTNSIRNLPFIERQRFIPFSLPERKTSWSLWNNSSFKYVGRNYDQISVLDPYAALSRYEYDISYSFHF